MSSYREGRRVRAIRGTVGVCQRSPEKCEYVAPDARGWQRPKWRTSVRDSNGDPGRRSGPGPGAAVPEFGASVLRWCRRSGFLTKLYVSTSGARCLCQSAPLGDAPPKHRTSGPDGRYETCANMDSSPRWSWRSRWGSARVHHPFRYAPYCIEWDIEWGIEWDIEWDIEWALRVARGTPSATCV